MGLCKCPKKKVTNLFCFEHRVNVCEHCLVSNHPNCIVQSYLQWLQDSDYDPTCRLCGQKLSGEDVGECVRLVCYDVFHWHCLDHYARQLPANTAPAGYTCPICKSGVFPASNVASPVAESLREVLTKVNWARVGLGLPLIQEPPPYQPDQITTSTGGAMEVTSTGDIPSTHMPLDNQTVAHQPAGVQATQEGQQVAFPTPVPSHYPAEKPSIPESVITMDNAAPYARTADKDFLSGHPADPRKLFDSTKGDYLNVAQDHDVDKYKRRPALQWFSRWFSSRSPKQRKDPNAMCKRVAIIVVLGLLGFITVLMIMSKVGRAAADNDPFLDPRANPHIQVND